MCLSEIPVSHVQGNSDPITDNLFPVKKEKQRLSF